MTKDMTVGSPMKLIIRFTIPICLGLLFQQMYSMVDTMIVGKVLGVAPLAGVGSTTSLNFMIIWFCLGICNGFAVPIAQMFGAKKETDMRRFLANSVWLCVIFGVVITVASAVFCGQMLALLRTPDDIYQYACTYLRIIFIGIPCTILYNFLAAVARALGDSKTPLMFLALSSAINIGLDLLFMIPLRMGVGGAALATVISQGVSGVVCFFYMKRKFTILALSGDEWRIRGACIRRLCLIALPMGLQYSITAIGSLVLQTAVNAIGSTAVAGMTAAQKISFFINCPIESLGQTMAPYAGQNIGAGKDLRVVQGVRAACVCGFVWTVVSIPLVWFLGRPMVLLFLDEFNEAVISYGFWYLFAAACSYAFLTMVLVFRFSIQGMGYSGFAMTAGFLEMAARIIAAVVLAPLIGYTAICLASPLAWVFADAFLIPAFFYCRRRAVRGKTVIRT